MGPRKNNAFSSVKDDGAATGKIRKGGTNGSSGNVVAGITNHKRDGSIKATKVSVSYTQEERSFLESQLALFTSAGGSSGDGTKFANMTKEHWMTGLPTLVSATEKLLKVAAEQYTRTCREHTAAAAATNGALSTAPSLNADDCGGGRHGTSSSSNDTNGPATDGLASGEAGGALGLRATPAGGSPAQFVEENAYIIAQAQQLQWYPFTYQRWIELLLDPSAILGADSHLKPGWTCSSMEPHVFCGPEFILEVPHQSVSQVLERINGASPPTESPATAECNTQGTSSEGPVSHGWTVESSVLLRIQTELYGVCTTGLRRHVHANKALAACMATDVRRGMEMVSRRMAQFGRIVLPASYGSISSGGVPPPPTEVTFVEVKPTTALSTEELASLQQSVRVAGVSSSVSHAASSLANDVSPSAPSTSTPNTYLLLCVTDSCVAAQLHMMCLRNTFIALPYGCRLLNHFTSTGRAAAIVPSQVLQKRELLRSHLNFDAELWSVLEVKLTDEFVEQVRNGGPTPSCGRLLTAFEQREQNVKAVLRYCEQNVSYAGVFDDDEEASPFLVAMGLCWRLGLTMDDVCRHFARHPRRVIRALALYLARYILAPEEYVYFFMPSFCDEVVIACTADAQVTTSMKDLSRQLLTKNDVVDAWLPLLSRHWQERVVAPMMVFMEACWRLQAQGGSGSGPDDSTPAALGTSTEASHLFKDTDGSAKDDLGRVHGAGRGIAATFGFRSIAEIADHAAQHARVLVPQSIATIVKRRRGLEEEVFGDGGGGGDDVMDVIGDDDDDDFLIHVDVRGDDVVGDGQGTGALGGHLNNAGGGLAFPSTKRVRTDEAKGGKSSGSVVLDPHRRIMREGLRLVLSLLGRRSLFRSGDEHYIEF